MNIRLLHMCTPWQIHPMMHILVIERKQLPPETGHDTSSLLQLLSKQGNQNSWERTICNKGNYSHQNSIMNWHLKRLESGQNWVTTPTRGKTLHRSYPPITMILLSVANYPAGSFTHAYDRNNINYMFFEGFDH